MGPIEPVTQADLDNISALSPRCCMLGLVRFDRRSVFGGLLLLLGAAGIGCWRIRWFVHRSGLGLMWFPVLLSSSAILLSLQMVRVLYLILRGLMRNFERLGFLTSSALSGGMLADLTLRESLRCACLSWRRFICLL